MLLEAHASNSMPAVCVKSHIRIRIRSSFAGWYFGLLLFCSLSQIRSGFRWLIRSNSNNSNSNDEPGIAPQYHSLPATIAIPVHNASSYVRSDVSKIVHVPEDSSIEVHLRPQSTRRCRNPLFRGRISGWSLSMIDFETSRDKKDKDEHEHEHAGSDVVVGKYDRSQMPVSGTYFVEMIVVLCEDYTRGEDFRGVRLRDQCLEDTTMSNHRITEGNGAASIDVVVVDRPRVRVRVQPKHASSSSGGRWLHRELLATERRQRDSRKSHTRGSGNSTNNDNHTQSHNGSEEMSAPEPLFTRYQPEECMISERRFKESKNTEFCRTSVDRTRFDSYTFRWIKGRDEILNKDVLVQPMPIPMPNREKDNLAKTDATNDERSGPPRQQHIHVCFVGASHSRVLNIKCQRLLKRTRKKAHQKGASPHNVPSVDCSFAEVRFPKNLTEDWVLSNLGGTGCTHAVVGLFQWPFSYAQDQPEWTFADWKAEMITATSILENAARGNNLPLQRVLLRSAHPNGFKWQITKCPPGDMRSPPNAKLASKILREIAESFSNDDGDDGESPIVSFVDTGFVTDPVWDSAEDWSHYNRDEGSVEAKFILTEILRESR